MSGAIYCRFCAETREPHEVMDLTTNPDLRSEIVEKLSIFNTNCIDFTDNKLPENVCLLCYTVLSNTNDFFDRMKISQVLLAELLSAVDKIDTNSCNDTDNESLSNFKVKADLETDECKNIEAEIIKQICGEDNAKADIISWSTYDWVCKYCKLNFVSVSNLRSHCQIEHQSCSGFQCVDCDFEEDDFNSFYEHVIGHRKELRRFCPYCNLKLDDGQTAYHIAKHMSERMCSQCGHIFPSQRLLREHLKQYVPDRLYKGHRKHKPKIIEVKDDESWKDFPWICQYCMNRLPGQETLRLHTKEVHNKCYGMQCPDCSRIGRIKSFAQFVEHVRKHRPNLRYFCEHCNYNFIDDYEKFKHKCSAKLLSSYLQCEICSEMFENQLDYDRHRLSYPPKQIRSSRGKPGLSQDFLCDICDKKFKSQKLLISHKETHTDRKRNYTCDRCGSAFYTKNALLNHVIIHENPNPQVCKICKKTFLTMIRLKKHVATHSNLKQFQCNECEKRFRLKEQLKNHMVTHSDEKPYSCHYCSKEFRFMNVLKVHENQHTGARPYCCSDCGKTFANWSNCNKHTKRKHGRTIAKHLMTPQGKLPVNPKTGQVKKIKDLDTVKEWTEQILESSRKKRNVITEG